MSNTRRLFFHSLFSSSYEILYDIKHLGEKNQIKTNLFFHIIS